MRIETFWKVVESLNWGLSSDGAGKTTDYKKSKRMLMAKLTSAQARQARKVLAELTDDLGTVLESVVTGISDDSFWDLRAHIIGLGIDEYTRVTRSPRLAQQRIDARQYAENFAYCFPHDDDYASTSPEVHVHEAKKVIAQLKRGLKDDRFEPVFPAVRALMELLAPAAEGDPRAILPNEKKALALRKKLTQRAKWLWRDAPYMDGSHFAVSHEIPNLFSDIREFLGRD